jgi:capsular polysaccharide biosynthesis protein
MLYTPEKGTEEGLGRTPPLATQIQMVKIPSNLEEVRERLKLATSLKALGRACRVWVERKTSLVFIRAKWDSPETVAAIANTLRDVFIENQMRLAKEDAAKDLRDLEARFKKVRNQLIEADERLQKFITTNKIVDLDMEVKWNLQQLTSLELLLSNAEVDRDTLEPQKANLQERINALKLQEEKERATQAKTKGLADLNIRIERLRRAIHDDKVQRSNSVDMVGYKLAFERAQKLYEKGLISKAEYEEARADFERQQVEALDTEQIKEWKRQLKILEKQVIPEKENFKSEAGEMLHDLQLKALAMELEEVSMRQKVIHLEKERKRIKARLEVLTDLQRKYAALTREVRARETESNPLDKELAKVRRDYQSNASNFTIISDAKVPLFRLKSNRKIIVIVVVFLLNVMGFTLILGLELVDTTIKSAAELTQKFSLPVLGVIPKIKDNRELFPEKAHFPLIEPFRIIVRRIRHLVPKRGARLMIVSVNQGEGKTMVATVLDCPCGFRI